MFDEGLEAMQKRHSREVRQHVEKYLGQVLPTPAGKPEYVHVEPKELRFCIADTESEQVIDMCASTSLAGSRRAWEEAPGPRAAAWQEDKTIDVGIEQISSFSGRSSMTVIEMPKLITSSNNASYKDRKIGFLKRLVTHPKYEVASGLLILANAFVIAWESENNALALQAGHFEGRATFFVVFMYLFCVLFVVELAMRVVALRRKFLFNRHGQLSKDARWNLFDTVCILGYVIEVVAEVASADPGGWTNSGLLRTVRLARALRVLHVLRAVTVFRDLRIMVASLVDALAPLLWFCVIVFLVLTSLGVVITNGVVDHLTRRDASDHEHEGTMADLAHDTHHGLMYYYGTLLTTVASLFMCITGGIDWEQAVEPLGHMSYLYKLMFYGFIAFAVFAMINVGNAIFLDAVLRRSKNDRDFVIEETTQEKRIFMKMMDNLFSELDTDNSNQISVVELKKYLDKNDVSTFLSALNLDVQQVSYLFRLMDSDGSGTIDRIEFREGCHKLRGDAKKLDLAIMQQEVKWIRSCMERLAEEAGIGEQLGPWLERSKTAERFLLGSTSTAGT